MTPVTFPSRTRPFRPFAREWGDQALRSWSKLAVSRKTKKNIFGTLKLILKQGRAWGNVRENIWESAKKIGKSETEVRTYTDAEVESVLSRSTGAKRLFYWLDHQEVGSFLLADVVERIDVRMIQISDSTCFALESMTQFGSAGEMIGQDFDCNYAIKTGVFCAVHLAHPTRTNGREDFVGAQVLADGNCHWFLPITNWATI